MVGPRRPRRVFLIFVLAAVTLLSLDLRGAGPLGDLQRGLRGAMSPVRDVVSAVTEPLGNAWDRLFDYGDLERENRELRQRLAQQQAEDLQAQIDSDAYQRLLEQLDFPYIGDLPPVTARVVRRTAGNFDPHRVEINRGSDHGIAVDMAVISGAGLIGTVETVDADSSIVRLITAPGAEFGVRISESGAIGLFKGNGSSRDGDLVMPSTDGVADGDIVITAGPEGGSEYPADIPVGVIELVEGSGDDALFRVVLVADVESLDFVTVVLFDAPDPLDEMLPGGQIPTTLPPVETTAPTTTTTTTAPVSTSTGPTDVPAAGDTGATSTTVAPAGRR